MITVNGTPLNVTLFPDNTSQVWKVTQLEIPDTNWVHVVWEFSHEGEFMHIAQLKALLDAKGFDCALRIKYLPYGRQDKLVSNETTFALNSFALLLNALNFSEILIHDPHSSVALKLINNSRPIYMTREVNRLINKLGTDILCYPDAGALDKYNKIYQEPYVYGQKVRDQLTGNILNYKLIGHPEGKNVLIVDDICDGGMTFKLLTKDLLAAGAKEVNLFVSHGIFSKGLRTLKESGIKRVFTQDGEASEAQGHIAYAKI